MKKSLKLFIILLIMATGVDNALAQIAINPNGNKIAAHVKQLDKNGNLLGWYKPEIPGASYTHVAKLASEFIKDGTPIDPASGLPLYYISCCFQGPHMRTQEEFDMGVTWEGWMHNPACVWAGLVQSLVLDYRVYSGDASYIDLVRDMLDYQLENGTTPSDWPWANVPYASSDPGETIYQGATRWEHDGMRGDGLHGVEPDKIGELGIAYLLFYEVTEELKYLDAAIHCANALVKYVKDEAAGLDPFTPVNTNRSPWPFRVNARTGVVIDHYCSNVIEPIRLFDELIRISNRIDIDTAISSYKNARKYAWDWLYSKNGPMKTSIWNAYFEDIPNDPDETNRVQITPMETARYLIKNPDMDPDLETNIPALVYWVASAFATDGMDAIKEQTWCYEPMGSHTARFASICAMWYEYTGDARFKEMATSYFNLATYMTDPNGVVRVGPSWPGSWFSDGYGDYIRHFMEGVRSIPEWAPPGENHLLKSVSVVQDIKYDPKKVTLKTFDDEGKLTFRLASKPKKVIVGSSGIKENKKGTDTGWTWESLNIGGILKVLYSGDNTITIEM
ncbi:hypothetical protein ACFLU5_02340 [Bacteroidota bacterium]